MNYYIASCVFTSRFPELSFRIQAYIDTHKGLQIVRCCVPKYKLQEFTDKMPASLQKEWSELPDSGDFKASDITYSLCHNCSAIIDESIDKLINGEDKVESFSKIEHNNDLTEFTVYVDGQKYTEMDSFTAIPFYIMGGLYQVYNGVDSEKTNVTVKFIDKDTGAILNTATSAEDMNS